MPDFARIPLLLLCSAAAVAGKPPAPESPTPELNPVLADLPVVEAAALHAQTLEEAPANVTVITADQIRTYGYRTLGEALVSARGFFSTYDHIYQYIGVRGLAALPGDYNTRFLVMINGHTLTENVYDASGYFGQDFGLDMDLVSRIEIVRGPTSALYGSNGILATINVVTKSPVDLKRLRASVETGTGGEKKVSMASSVYLGGGANLLFSGSVFNNTGSSMEFRPNHGVRTPGVDGERGYHSFANLVWRDWNFTTYWNSREKAAPIPWGDAYLDLHPGNRVRDSRNFVSAVYTRPAGPSGTLQWKLYYDNFAYDDRFDYALEDGFGDSRSLARGDWAGTQLRYRQSLGKYGDLTAGGQLDFDIRNLQQNFEQYPVYQLGPRMDHRDQRQAAFLQEEYQLGKRWTACLGLRLDHSRLYGSFLSPRLALVYQASPATTYKFVFARPFRRPSAFERFYDDGGASFLSNPDLSPETAHTWEFSYERRLRPWLNTVAGAYFYRIKDVIEADFLPGDVEQYRNGPHSQAIGFEWEINARSARGLEGAASYSVLRVRNASGADVLNSPAHIGKVRSAWRTARGRLSLAASAQAISPRLTRTGDWTRPVFLLDVTATTVRLHPQFDLQFGLRNLAGWRYQEPAALAYDRVPADGRSVWLKLIWRLPE